MALSTETKTLNDGALALADGTGSPVTLTVPVSVGDFAISDIRASSLVTSSQNEVVAYEARGVLDTVRHTTRIYPSGSFTIHFREFTSATAGVVQDFLTKSNAYSANISTLAAGATADVYCVKITLTVDGTTLGDDANAVAVLG